MGGGRGEGSTLICWGSQRKNCFIFIGLLQNCMHSCGWFLEPGNRKRLKERKIDEMCLS